MINYIKQAVESVEGIKSFLFNTDYRNNFDLQNVEFPCCVLTPIMRTNYDLKNIIHESAELQLSIVDLAPYEYTGDDLYAINKRCSDLALQVIANLQVKSKLDKELTFEFILPSGDELVSGVMCNLQCTMRQGSCNGAPSYVEVVVQPTKRVTLYQNGEYNITPDAGFNAMKGVTIDVNVDLSNYYTKQETDNLLADKLSTTELDSAIDDALAQAKESGEFKGEKGDKGDKGDKGEDGRDGYVTPIVNQSATTATIQPNVLNVWGEVATLDITLATPSDTSIVNEYMVQFTSGATPTQLVLPDIIEWMSEPTINANAVYQLSIINNLAVIGGFKE